MRSILILLFASVIFSCSSTKDVNNSCILDLINQLKSQPKTNPARSIYQYEYNGKIVYFVPQVCCDIPSSLYDGSCNLLCHPDGGFTGRGDGKCTNFFEKRTKEKLIWKDDRK